MFPHRPINNAYFLIDSKGHSTQAYIKNSLGIPKTSLVRIFETLEAKRIASVEMIGKMKKITLTDWFMGRT